MAFWVLAENNNHKRDLLGPYYTRGRAEDVVEGLFDPNARIFKTQAEDYGNARKEIQAQRVEKEGIEVGHQNFHRR